MIDLIKLHLIAGNGGNGRVSFRREKFVPKGGPDGGFGGDGGNIILVADPHVTTLSHFFGKKKFAAPNGGNGGKRQSTGAKGEDIILPVPVGTVVWLLAETPTSKYQRQFQPREGARQVPDQPRQRFFLTRETDPVPFLEPEELGAVTEMPAELEEKILTSESLKGLDIRQLPKEELISFTEPGQQYVIARGGHGGRGNMAFKGPAKTTPLEAEYGAWGEQKMVVLELKLLADVGLVGLPNAGKSTLLSVLTSARPKVANYPFTTLEPHLGVWRVGTAADSPELVIADIPGLIEGASQGKGLGFEFLRHVEHCRALLYVVSLEDSELALSNQDPAAAADVLWQRYQLLQRELASYGEALIHKHELIVVNKSDVYSEAYKAALLSTFTHYDKNILLISAATRAGLGELETALADIANTAPSE